MRTMLGAVAIAVLSVPLVAQEQKPVPKDSVRVSVPGCARGYVFTAGRRTAGEPSTAEIPEGMHLRMNGPRKLMKDIKAHEGSMIELTGIMRKGQYRPGGVGLGGGISIAPAPGPGAGGFAPAPVSDQPMIDVESWRPIVGDCPTR